MSNCFKIKAKYDFDDSKNSDIEENKVSKSLKLMRHIDFEYFFFLLLFVSLWFARKIYLSRSNPVDKNVYVGD